MPTTYLRANLAHKQERYGHVQGHPGAAMAYSGKASTLILVAEVQMLRTMLTLTI